MDERILEQVSNVPYYGEDAYLELETKLKDLADANNISSKERKRLNYELEKIKEWGIAKVFLFGNELCSFKEGITISVENNSYVNYLLKNSLVNSCLYNLPFERFFNEYRKIAPFYTIHVKKGFKGEMLKRLYEKYGKNMIVRGFDNKCIYHISNKSFSEEIIKDKVIIAENNFEAYEENISRLSYLELDKLGYYSFGIIEYDNITYQDNKEFLDSEIYQKASELFSYKIPDMPTFTDIDDITKILKNTEYKLVYQEQLLEILNKICCYNYSEADYFRKELSKAKRSTTAEIEKILNTKYGENGEKLYEYLIKNGRYTVAKGYVLGALHAFIEYDESVFLY